MTAHCDTCPNAANLPLVVWADVFRCYACAGVQASPSGFEDVEPWYLLHDDAHDEPRMPGGN